MTQKTLFLDRDGTVIVECDYLSDPEKVVLEEGAISGLKRFSDAGFSLAIVSNQSGIARGFFGEKELFAVNQRLDTLLRAEGIVVSSWQHCPHGPGDECTCRKPKPGMLDKVDSDNPVDWSASLMVGDKSSDIEAAQLRGVRGALVKTGHGSSSVEWAETHDVPVFENLQAVAEYFLEA